MTSKDVHRGAQLESSTFKERDAERWYLDANQSGAATGTIPFVDDDPPFFLRQSPFYDGSLQESPSHRSSFRLTDAHHAAPLTHSALSRLELSEENPNIYRDVIDDLTVQNKKLSRRIEQYERLYESHLTDSKLFDVHVHNLSAQKKRELEGLLRDFACGLETVPSGEATRQRVPETLPSFDNAVPTIEKPSSATTTYKRPLDSTYASISASGQTRVSFCHHIGSSSKAPDDSTSADQPNLIAEPKCSSLSPSSSHSSAESDKGKKSLVVQKLERLFTGDDVYNSPVNSSIGYQSTSPLTVEAENMAINKQANTGNFNKQVHRTTRIWQDSNATQAHSTAPETLEPQPLDNAIDESGTTHKSPGLYSHAKSEQQPMDSLDQNLSQSQSMTKGIGYIRHLGITSSSMKDKPHSNDDWIYINLLTSMAQLHTLNVTPSFVRQAIVECSTHLELSEDGRKVRWRTGSEHSKSPLDHENFDGSNGVRNKLPTETPCVEDQDQTSVTELSGQGSHSVTFADETRSTGTSLGRMEQVPRLEQRQNFLSSRYEPLFVHHQDSDDQEIIENEDASSMSSTEALSDDMSFGANSHRDSVAKIPKLPSGPIIFFNKASFCIDKSRNALKELNRDISYARTTSGTIAQNRGPSSKLHGSKWRKRRLFTKILITEPNADQRGARMDTPLVQVHEYACPQTENPVSSGAIGFDWEASGLGSVQLDDNFVVDVRTRRTRQPRKIQSCSRQTHLSCRIPDTHLEVSHGKQSSRTSSDTTKIESRIVSSIQTKLPPSQLPPPSYAWPPSPSDTTDSGSEDFDFENDETIFSTPQFRLLPFSRPASLTSSPRPSKTRPIKTRHSPSACSVSSSSDTSNGSDDSASELDVPAYAEEADPSAIVAQEEEFESAIGNLPDLPTGSSAATTGGWGGSGTESEEFMDASGAAKGF
ncbi:MAG: hypothetical protein Q9167_003763 [Letrouitia subvulpina]